MTVLSKEAVIGRSIGELCHEKSKAYGDSIQSSAKIMKTLYPNGVPVESYMNVLVIVRIIDKLMRIATDKDAFGESPFKDIAGYAIRMIEIEEAKNDKEYTEVSESLRPWSSYTEDDLYRYCRDNGEVRREPAKVWKVRAGGTVTTADLQQECDTEYLPTRQNVCSCGQTHSENSAPTEAELLVHRGDARKAQAQRSCVQGSATESHRTIFGQRR